MKTLAAKRTLYSAVIAYLDSTDVNPTLDGALAFVSEETEHELSDDETAYVRVIYTHESQFSDKVQP
jgi:hypothetical protein